MTVDRDIIVSVVDDDEMVRNSLRALLEAHRFQVRDFASARQYLKSRDGSVGGCLLLDLHMPDMNGLELLQVLKKSRDSVPVVVFTGRNDPGLEARARALGAADVLDKPITYKALFAAIERALGSKAG